MHKVRGSCPQFFIKQLFWKFSEICKKYSGGTVLLLASEVSSDEDTSDQNVKPYLFPHSQAIVIISIAYG